MEFEILGKQEVLNLIHKFFKEIASYVPKELNNKIWELIFKHNWNKQFILDDIRQQINTSSQHLSLNSDDYNNNEKSLIKRCLICEIDFQYENIVLNCYHYFCDNCWDQYLISKMEVTTDVLQITCPETNCSLLLDYMTLNQISSFSSVETKFFDLMIESFVSNNQNFQFCLNPNCKQIIKLFISDAFTVKCVCGTRMCSKCGKRRHFPINCNLLEKMSLKLSPEVMKNFERLDVKRCPKCLIFIEKSGGCNTMFCIWCHHMFDWNRAIKLFGDFEDSYQQIAENDKLMEEEKILRHRLRTKYYNHLDSLKLIDTSFDTLSECRHSLQLFYIFAYFVEKSPHLRLFELKLNSLVSKITELSQLMTTIYEMEIKPNQRVEELSNLCGNIRESLADQIKEGDEQGYWQYDQNKLMNTE